MYTEVGFSVDHHHGMKGALRWREWGHYTGADTEWLCNIHILTDHPFVLGIKPRRFHNTVSHCFLVSIAPIFLRLSVLDFM